MDDPITKLISVMEESEAASGMDKEFGESFGDMMNRFKDDLGEEKSNELLTNVLGSFFTIPTTKDEDHWFNLQKDLYPKIKGFKISRYYDGELGACLAGKHGKYFINVGIEDAESIDNIEYYTISLNNTEETWGGGEILFHSGIIFDLDVLPTIINLCDNNNIVELINIINNKHYDRETRTFVDTCECALKVFHEKALEPYYTSSVNLHCTCNE